MVGKYKKTLPDSKLTDDPESKQVVKILKAVFPAQKKKLGGDASVSPNDHPHHLLYLNPVLQAILAALAAHKSNPLPAHQYQAYVIKSAAYRLLFLVEKELADRMKEAVKEAKENPKPATKRAEGGAAGRPAKKLKIAGLPAKWRHLGFSALRCSRARQ